MKFAGCMSKNAIHIKVKTTQNNFQNWQPWYNWNFVESGIKYHNHNINL